MKEMTTNKERIAKLMGAEKYVIACAHLIPLPGATGYDREGGMKKIIKQALRDTQIFLDNGVTSIMFVNEADIPFYERLPIEGIAAFTSVVTTIVSQLNIKIPYGINSINDAGAGLCIANATGASFLRGNFAGVLASNQGIYISQACDLYRKKANLGMKQIDPPFFFHNLGNDHGHDLTERDPLSMAKSLAMDTYAQPHGWAISPEDLTMVQAVKKATPEFPVVACKSTNHENIKPLMEVFDGTIVASSMHEDGRLFAQVDPDRTKRFMDIFHSIK
jgi:membrane complex biogenesis BtpA family protein